MESLKSVLLLILAYSLYMLGNICANIEDDLYAHASIGLYCGAGVTLYFLVTMLITKFVSVGKGKE
jgi:hypothetical protein